MLVSDHLLNDIKPLKLTEKVSDVLDLMEELKYGHLPIVEQGTYLGIVCDDDLLEVDRDNDELSMHSRLFKGYSINHSTHLFDALKVIGEGQLSLLPVVGEAGRYLGYLSPLEIIQDLGRQLTFTESGSVMVLQIPVRDYHLSQIAQIVEQEDARIIGFHLYESQESDQLFLALKINQTDLSKIIKSFERFNYNIHQVFHESLFDNSTSDRYESLMKYLNI